MPQLTFLEVIGTKWCRFGGCHESNYRSSDFHGFMCVSLAAVVHLPMTGWLAYTFAQSLVCQHPCQSAVSMPKMYVDKIKDTLRETELL